MSSVPRNVIVYCADECDRQQSGELSVVWMIDGWLYARKHAAEPITLAHALTLGRLIEPVKNTDGFRRQPVHIGLKLFPHPDETSGRLERLISRQDPHHAEAWYRAFEDIHPFIDGNGRTGSLLMNWLAGTLDAPQTPPQFWREG